MPCTSSWQLGDDGHGVLNLFKWWEWWEWGNNHPYNN
jgi:hypothetical protein